MRAGEVVLAPSASFRYVLSVSYAAKIETPVGCPRSDRRSFDECYVNRPSILGRLSSYTLSVYDSIRSIRRVTRQSWVLAFEHFLVNAPPRTMTSGVYLNTVSNTLYIYSLCLTGDIRSSPSLPPLTSLQSDSLTVRSATIHYHHYY